MRLETAFNLCTISSRAISSFLSQNLILPQNKTILCSCFPLHQKVLHGWGSVSGEGARLRGWGWGGTVVPSFQGLVPSPAKGRALRQGGGCSAEAEARPPRVLPRPPGSSVCTPAVTWKPRTCTFKVTREPCVCTYSGHLELKCVHPPIV